MNRLIVWSLVFLGLGALAGVGDPSARGANGACPAGVCLVVADGPTYSSGSCVRSYRGYYGGTAEMITATAYSGCGGGTTVDSQAALYKSGDPTILDTAGTSNLIGCGHLDCNAPLTVDYHHTSLGCVCALATNYYCTQTVKWYQTAAQNGCLLSNLTVSEDTSPVTKSPAF